MGLDLTLDQDDSVCFLLEEILCKKLKKIGKFGFLEFEEFRKTRKLIELFYAKFMENDDLKLLIEDVLNRYKDYENENFNTEF